MAKSADAFRTISEVADWLDTPAHVLRFWESKFSQLKPVKRAGGRRYYRPSDMLLLGGIKKLLHTDGMTIKGVQKLLREQGIKTVSEQSQPLDDVTAAEAEDATIDASAEVVSPPAETVEDFQRGALEATPSHPVEITGGGGEDAPAGTAQTEAAAGEIVDPVVAEEAANEPAAGEPVAEAEIVEEAESSAAPATKVEDAPAEETAPQETSDEAPVLPSFMHRTAVPEQTTEAPETVEETAPEEDAPEEVTPPAPKPNVVDVPDDPADDVPAEPGILNQVATLRAPISNEMADRLGQVLERLRQSRNGNGPGQSS